MKKNRKAAWCTVTGLALSMMVSSQAMAAADNNKCGGKNMAVANVENELLIRSSASDGGTVIGYLPSAAGVIVESMDEEWTKIRSGNVSGYVKTDYLAFGEKADELKSVYGVQGAVASWNDVKIFADHEDTSSIIGTLNEGEGFEVLGSSEDWVEIQLQNGDTAYVAAEDVDMTLVLDTAVATDEYAALAAEETAQVYADDATYTEDVYYPEDIYYEDSASYADGTDDTYTETYSTEAYTYDAAYTDDTAYTDETAYTDNTVYTDNTGYTDTTVYDVPETEAVAADPNDGLTGDEYIDPETEAQETEAAAEASASSSQSASASSSDVDLLAALIYCEAGNQSAEGKVAVGQVVMNRVASSSFGNSIHDVIYESGQFTPASSGWLDQVIGSAPSDCYDAALAALNGEGTVGDSLYFNAGSGKGMQIGDHQFY